MNIARTSPGAKRVVLIGDISVGKTSIIQNLISEPFVEGCSQTVGATYVMHPVRVDAGEVTMQIWDTAGEERYRCIAPIYYQKADAAVVVFDHTRQCTFAQLDGWVAQFAQFASDAAPVVVLGNKIDLDARREVAQADVDEWVARTGRPYWATSARTGAGIAEAFAWLARALLRGQGPEETVDVAPEMQPRRSCC